MTLFRIYTKHGFYLSQHRRQQRVQQGRQPIEKKKVEQDVNTGKIYEVCLNQISNGRDPFLPHFQTSRSELRKAE